MNFELKVYVADIPQLKDLDAILTDRLPGYTKLYAEGMYRAASGQPMVEEAAQYVFVVDTRTDVKLILGWFGQFLNMHTSEESLLYTVNTIEGGLVMVNDFSTPEASEQVKSLKREEKEPWYQQCQVNGGIIGYQPRSEHKDIGKGTGYSGHPRVEV